MHVREKSRKQLLKICVRRQQSHAESAAEVLFDLFSDKFSRSCSLEKWQCSGYFTRFRDFWFLSFRDIRAVYCALIKQQYNLGFDKSWYLAVEVIQKHSVLYYIFESALRFCVDNHFAEPKSGENKLTLSARKVKDRCEYFASLVALM